LIENLKNTIKANDKRRETFASIFVADLTKLINTDTIYKALNEDDGVTVAGICMDLYGSRMKYGNMEQVDYVLILYDDLYKVSDWDKVIIL
jgi:hypothetical protein